MRQPQRAGAVVVSLDFELHWGVRDHVRPGDPYVDALLAARDLVVEILALFRDSGTPATWAVVGALFASTREELERFSPLRRPRYRRTELDPYQEAVGFDEAADPLHLAWSLVARIAATPAQEVASHTFSHFYCLEEGQDAGSFGADLAAAQAIAAHRGLHLESLVLPRNQVNPRYRRSVVEAGFRCIRGPQPGRGHRPGSSAASTLLERGRRMVDTYLGPEPPPTTAWSEVAAPDGLCDVPASAFLRPLSPRRMALEPLRRARLRAGLLDAARRGRVFHIWWHPHNFARCPEASLALVSWLFEEVERLGTSDGLEVMTMAGAARAARCLAEGAGR